MAMCDYRGESQNNTNTMDPRVEKIMIAAEYIAAKLDGRKPFAGIVLGSGLGKLADKIENPTVIPYKEIPGFPVSTAVGHKGNFIAGELCSGNAGAFPLL